MADPLGASPIPERVEFLSDDWLAAAEGLLGRCVAAWAHELEGVGFSLSEAFSDAPPHLGLDGNLAAWTFRLKDGKVTVKRGRNSNVDLLIEGDYQAMLPVAQAVGPKAMSRAQKQARHVNGQGWVQVKGAFPTGRLADILAELHDYLARRTVENPDLAHRIARQGLTAQVAQLERDGYTVIENAISESFADELRDACLAEGMEHRSGIPKSGRIDCNGLLGRGRCFEEIVQHPKLRTVIESSLGAGMILHTVGGCVMQPGPGAAAPHVDYVAIPEPFPEFAVMGVAVWNFEDWNVAAGPTWIIPGSQDRRRAPKPGESLEGGVPILMPKGSVTFFTQGVWHWQGDRTTPGPRVSMHNAYSRAFMRQADDFSGLDAVFHRNCPVVSSLAGKDDYFGRTSYRGHDYERMNYMIGHLRQEKKNRYAMAADA
jgi:ectoine hydroxylase-related dioxygenase (phytanoyl-CoA dioxygenase family)